MKTLAHPEYDTENVKMNYNDYEGRMSKQNLYKLYKYSGELLEMLHDHQEMESWVQEKIAKAADYIASVKHYLDYEMQYPGQKNAFDDDSDPYEMGFNEVHSLDDILPAIKKVLKKIHLLSLEQEMTTRLLSTKFLKIFTKHT